MEIIDWIKEDAKNNLISHYLIEAMSRVGDGDLKEFGKLDASSMQVEMKVNDVEVPFSFFFGLLEQHFKDYEKELEKTAATKIISAKVEEIKGRITDSLSDVFGLDPWDFK